MKQESSLLKLFHICISMNKTTVKALVQMYALYLASMFKECLVIKGGIFVPGCTCVRIFHLKFYPNCSSCREIFCINSLHFSVQLLLKGVGGRNMWEDNGQIGLEGLRNFSERKHGNSGSSFASSCHKNLVRVIQFLDL